MWSQLGAEFPETSFLAFTKRWDIVEGMGDTYDAIERMNGRYDATLWTLHNLGLKVDIKDCKHSIKYGTQKIAADRETRIDA